MANWTDEQKSAIITKDCDLLVAAAAGSGKTAVLVERIIQRITNEVEPVDIDRLLVVTFTNAAASEMRRRIGEGISRCLEQNPESRYLQKQLLLLNKAYIMTIHSFCLDVVRSGFNLLNLDPTFRIGDETEILLLKSEVIDELFEELYSEEHNSGFISLVETFGENTKDTRLQELVLKTYEFIQSDTNPAEWLREKTEQFDVDDNTAMEDTVWGRVLTTYTQLQLDYLQTLIKRAWEYIEQDCGPISHAVTVRADNDLIDSLAAGWKKGINGLYNAIKTASFTKVARAKDGEEYVEELRALRDEIKKAVEDLRNKYYKPPIAMKEELKRLYPVVKTLGEVVDRFAVRFAAAKREKNIIDFNDIEHFCLKALKNFEGVAEGYRERFVEIYIDEYQDSNYVQEYILNAVSRAELGSPNRFMVGDVKQSIYKFRLAAPEIFLEKYHNSDGDKRVKIDLSKNFRSRDVIIHSVNYIFKQIMTARGAEIEYDENAELKTGAAFPEFEGVDGSVSDNTEIILIDTKDMEEEETATATDADEELTKTQMEARVVAGRIHEMLGREGGLHIYDSAHGKYRRVTPGDIVILLRAAGRTSKVYSDELMKCGISAYAESNTGFFDEIEVMTMMSLLQIIDNPFQDIHLLTVLHSPIFSFDGNELAELRTVKRRSMFYDCLMAVKSGLHVFESDALTEKVRSFLCKLELWRDKQRFLSTDELLRFLYADTNYYNYVGIMTGGDIRQANLRLLKERAEQFEQTSYKGLFNFIRFIEKQREVGGDYGEAKIVGENENHVKIMSIHKSKGLEFPVVFVCGLGGQFNMTDSRKQVLFHNKLGLGMDYTDYDRRVKHTTISKITLAQVIKYESLAEEMRILYVALTRPKEKLVMTGAVKGLEQCIKKWTEAADGAEDSLPVHTILQARSSLDWIMPPITRHRDFSAEQKNRHNGYYTHPSRWKLVAITKGGIQQNSVEDQARKTYQRESFEQWDTSTDYSGSRSEVFRRLGYAYPYLSQAMIPIKTSISEMKRQFQLQQMGEAGSSLIQTEVTFSRPQFLTAKSGLTAAERGTAIHTVMEHLDFTKNYTVRELAELLEEMTKKGLLTDEERESIPIPKILAFAGSDIGERLRSAAKIFKEQPFVLGVNPSEVYGGTEYSGEEMLLVHGMIDCFFIEDDGGDIILLDYKTDYISDKGAMETVKQRYAVQLDIYKRAIEAFTGLTVRESYIYFFSIDSAVLITGGN